MGGSSGGERRVSTPYIAVSNIPYTAYSDTLHISRPPLQKAVRERVSLQEDRRAECYFSSSPPVSAASFIHSRRHLLRWVRLLLLASRSVCIVRWIHLLLLASRDMCLGMVWECRCTCKVMAGAAYNHR